MSNPTNRGFVRVYRNDMDDPLLWETGHEFTRYEAWMDIVVHRARGIPNGDLKQGQFQASLAELAGAWLWTRPKVQRYMDALVDGRRLAIAVAATRTAAPVYEVVNFAAKYNGELNPNPANSKAKTPAKRAVDTPRDTGRDTPRDTPKPAPVVALEATADTPADTAADTQTDTYIRKKERIKNGGMHHPPNPLLPNPENFDEAISKTEQETYADTIEQAFNELPVIRQKHRLSAEERQLAFEWFARKLPTKVVEIGLWYGAARCVNPNKSPPARSVSSLKYFGPVVDEVASVSGALRHLDFYAEHYREQVLGFFKKAGGGHADG